MNSKDNKLEKHVRFKNDKRNTYKAENNKDDCFEEHIELGNKGNNADNMDCVDDMEYIESDETNSDKISFSRVLYFSDQDIKIPNMRRIISSNKIIGHNKENNKAPIANIINEDAPSPIQPIRNPRKQKYEDDIVRKIPQRNNQMIVFTVGLSMTVFILWVVVLSMYSKKKGLEHLAWIALVLLSVFILLFPIHLLVSGCFNMLGPTDFIFENSRYYSCRPMKDTNVDLEKGTIRHVSIQIPIYKEDFETIIKYTLRSAILCKHYYKTHPEHRIKVNIMVCDDGLQVISEQEREKRLEYYLKRKIAYIARPPHKRRGLFKKASNLNFSMNFIERVNEFCKNVTLPHAINMAKEDYDKRGLSTFADGELAIGDYILILDADSRIPKDCLHNVLTEFESDEKLGLVQYLTYPLVVTNTYWEQFIAHFTTLVYELGILTSCAGGDCAPLVGHNAILKVDVMNKVKKMNNVDGTDLIEQTIWDENSVSEDFRYFMDMTSLGYYGRYVTYANNVKDMDNFELNNFMEGISLEYVDELGKFRKYAYGSFEILYNPLSMWICSSFIGKPIRRYFKSNIEFTSKMGVLSYLFTYTAVGISLPLSIMNYILFGWYPHTINKNVLPIHVVIQVMLLFSGWGTFTNSVFKMRIFDKINKDRNDFINILWDSLWFIPMYLLFFGSLPFNICEMMFYYFLGIKRISWGATVKEVNYSTKFHAILDTFYNFKFMLLFFLSILLCTSYLLTSYAGEWRITNTNAIIPLWMQCVFHILAPFLLNPYIMSNRTLERIALKDDGMD